MEPKLKEEVMALYYEAKDYANKWDVLNFGALPEGVDVSLADHWPPELQSELSKRSGSNEAHIVHYLFPNIPPDQLKTLRQLAQARAQMVVSVALKNELTFAQNLAEFKQLKETVRFWNFDKLVPVQIAMLEEVYLSDPFRDFSKL